MHALLAAGIPQETDPTGMHEKFSHLSSSLYLLLFIVGVFVVVLIFKRRKSADQTSAPTCSYCGADIKTDESICPQCGNPLVQSQAASGPARRPSPQLLQAALFLGAFLLVFLLAWSLLRRTHLIRPKPLESPAKNQVG